MAAATHYSQQGGPTGPRRVRLWISWLVALVMWLPALPPAVAATGRPIAIATGAGSFTFVDERGDPAKPMTVHTYLPRGLEAKDATIVFVMHGKGKNARGYRDAWIAPADKHRFMIVAPLFDPAQWDGGEYSYASIVTGDGSLRDPALWSFSLIEHLFDAIRSATGNKSPQYLLYGHSEGGQFVHRLVLLLPEARYAKAVAANPGWYTMPVFDVRFPYGLAGTQVTRETLKKSLARNLVLMLGDQDTDPAHKELRRTPKAMAQGPHRYARGRNFFDAATRSAHDLQTPLGWTLQVVPGAAHNNGQMARPAAAALTGR